MAEEGGESHVEEGGDEGGRSLVVEVCGARTFERVRASSDRSHRLASWKAGDEQLDLSFAPAPPPPSLRYSSCARAAGHAGSSVSRWRDRGTS